MRTAPTKPPDRTALMAAVITNDVTSSDDAGGWDTCVLVVTGVDAVAMKKVCVVLFTD